MRYIRFESETGEPCSEEFNRSVNELFDEHPVLFEMFRFDKGLTLFLIKEMLAENIKDWDDREEIASYMETHWNNPQYAGRITNAITVLRKNAPKA